MHGKLLRLAGADIDKAYDLQDEDDDGTHAECEPSEERGTTQKKAERMKQTSSLSACFTLKETYFELLMARRATTIPTEPMR